VAFYQLLHLCVERGKDFLVCGDESRLGAIASCQVLRGNDGNGVARVGTNKKYLAVIVGKVCTLNNLCNESPQFECLVCRLVVEYEIKSLPVHSSR